MTAKELATLLNGLVEGNPEVQVSRPSKIEEGGEGTISFLANAKYEHFVYTTDASVLLVDRKFQPKGPVKPTLIRVDDVYAAVAILLKKFGSQDNFSSGISNRAFIHPSAILGKNISVGAFSVVRENAVVAEGCVIYPQVYIGRNVKLGKGVTLYPGVRILHDCKVGDNCIIHANTVIGSDGFGFAPQADGSYQKIAHVGNVILEDDVEIGANTAIDRATMGSTIIKKGVKLDNLIQVGHNVEIGTNTVVAAQTGIAGSTKIGTSCRIGGQVGFVGHIQVADGTQIQAQSGIASAVREPSTALFGSPAIPYRDYIRSYAVFKKLPELYRRLHELEKQVREM